MKAYIYRNVFTFDEEKMDDYIFEELSKYRKGYPDTESEWQHVEEIEMDIIEELCEWLDNGYQLLEATR